MNDTNTYKFKIQLRFMTTNQALGFWVVGAICVFLGAVVAGSIEPTVLGATFGSVMIAYIIAFILILIGGMFWISAATVHEEE